MKLKALAAVVALAFAGQANAAFNNDGMTGGTWNGDGSGSLVLSLINDTDTTDTSFAIDLGASLTTGAFFDPGVAAQVVLNNNADLNTFLAGATGTVRWDITGIINDGNTGELGILQTYDGKGYANVDPSTVENGMTLQGAWMDSMLSQSGGSTDHIGFDDAYAPGAHGDPNTHAKGRAGEYVSEGLLGETLDFVAFLTGDGAHGEFVDFNDFTLTWAGGNATLTYGQASVVPVPAAAWLFGSAMLGMVGVARRKAA
jgi:hypothetical protein